MKENKKLNEALMRDKTKKQMQNLLKDINRQGGDIGSRVRKDEKTKEDKMPNVIYMDNPFDSDRFIDTWEHFSKHDSQIQTATDKMNDSKRGVNKAVKTFENFDKEETSEEVIIESFETAALELISDLENNTDKYNISEEEINEFKELLKNDDKQEFVTRYVQRTKRSINDLPSEILSPELLEARNAVDNVTKVTEAKKTNKKEKAVLDIDDWIQTLDPDIIGTTCDKTRPMFVNRPSRKDRPEYDVLRAGKFIEFKDTIGQIIGIKNGKLVLDIIVDDKHETKEFDVDEVLKTLKTKKIEESVNLTPEELEGAEKIEGGRNPFVNRYRLKDSREFDITPKGDISLAYDAPEYADEDIRKFNDELTPEELEGAEKIDSPQNDFTNRYRLKDGRVFDVTPNGEISQVMQESVLNEENSYDDFLMRFSNEIQIAIETLKRIIEKVEADEIDDETYENGFKSIDRTYDDRVVGWIDSSLAPNTTISVSSLARMAIENQDATGTEPHMVLYAIEELGRHFGV